MKKKGLLEVVMHVKSVIDGSDDDLAYAMTEELIKKFGNRMTFSSVKNIPND